MTTIRMSEISVDAASSATANAALDAATVDAAALAADLRRSIQGEVRFDSASRALYATDASNYRQMPIGVVIPRSVEDVVATVAACRRHGAPILSRGGGTSLAGQSCNVAVIMDFSKYLNAVVSLDPATRRARVQPGVVLDDVCAAGEAHRLIFAPDPATHNHCTIGGMIGNNSCGTHSVMWGKTVDNIEELEILTYDGLRLRVGRTSDDEIERIIAAGGRRGEIYAQLRDLRDRYADLIRARYPHIPRRVSGYNLDQLLPENGFNVARALVGTESTCVTVLEATLCLVESPPVRVLAALGYPDVERAGDAVMGVLPYKPLALEGLDDVLLDDLMKQMMHEEDVALLPEGGGWLLAEFGGETLEEARDRAQALIVAMGRVDDPPQMRLLESEDEQERIWKVRESGLGATARVPNEPDTWEGWEDSAVPPDRLGDYLRDLRALYDRHGYHGSFYGHFGDGCIHTRIDFDLTSQEGVASFRSFIEAAADLVVRYGGSLSGEHGDGQSRAELLPRMYGEELVQAFREFKAIWDPDGKMNPGKVVDPYRLDENLRLGTSYRPKQLQTHFAFPDDDGGFSRAVLRCVGIGECRRTEGGTMCPSYRATGEELHSTRGRARLLFEMLRGDAIADGWRSEEVKEALDLCLACKGCKSECPVSVDMATYKAEFLSHYYAGRPRPLTAYTLGLIPWWARLAALAPGLVNAVAQTYPLSAAAKALAGVAPQRRLPLFAPRTFKQRFQRRGPRNVGAPTVILWADTFNNHFHPETCRAAVEVLEAAGYRVAVPPQPLCCGRPLYDYGMLGLAKRQLRQILATLRPAIARGVPVIGLEPSCVAVFRDELPNLFPHDEDAKRLCKQTFTLAEFLVQKATHVALPRLERPALLHGHCHQKAIMKLDAETAVLRKLGLDLDVLDSGCCGMAGAFGFEKGEHYDISIKVGEHALLPAVRAAAPETLVIADGFSCREQIHQTTDRRALHLAEVLRLAMRESTKGSEERS